MTRKLSSNSYMIDLYRSINWYNYAPVFRVSFQNLSYMFKYESYLKGEVSVELQPLRRMEGFKDLQRTGKWLELLGFDVLHKLHESFTIAGKSTPSHEKMCMGDFYGRSGKTMNECALQHPLTSEGQKCEFGSIINFKLNPVHKLDETALRCYLYSRNCSKIPSSVGRQELIDLVLQSVARKEEPEPISDSEGVRNYGSYDRVDKLNTASKSWLEFDNSIVEKIRDKNMFVEVYSAYVDSIYNMSRQTEKRGADRLLFGSLVVSTLRYMSVEDQGVSYLFFRVKIKPSMNQEPYMVTVMFSRNDNSEQYKYSKAPDSFCECLNGRVFCSHLTVFCLFGRLIQLRKKKPKLQTAEDVINILPEYIEAITDNFLDLATILSHNRKRKSTTMKSIMKINL